MSIDKKLSISQLGLSLVSFIIGIIAAITVGIFILSTGNLIGLIGLLLFLAIF